MSETPMGISGYLVTTSKEAKKLDTPAGEGRLIAADASGRSVVVTPKEARALLARLRAVEEEYREQLVKCEQERQDRITAEAEARRLRAAGDMLASRLRQRYPIAAPHPEIERALQDWNAALTPPHAGPGGA